MAEWIAERARAHGPGYLLGLSGAQGSGKSTLAAILQEALGEAGLRVAVLSLDDVYLTRAEREALAARTHPLLRTRGPPGTHDVALAETTLQALVQPGTTRLPRFDKSRDDRRPETEWEVFHGPADVGLLEGWCVGARPQPPSALIKPVNALEEKQDPEGVWRRFVNDALAGPYQPLFGRLNALVLLRAPGFEGVAGWRREQERALGTARGMTDAEVDAFVLHYERLTRWMLEDLPGRADVRIDLAADRSPTWASPPAAGTA